MKRYLVIFNLLTIVHKKLSKFLTKHNINYSNLRRT